MNNINTVEPLYNGQLLVKKSVAKFNLWTGRCLIELYKICVA